MEFFQIVEVYNKTAVAQVDDVTFLAHDVRGMELSRFNPRFHNTEELLIILMFVPHVLVTYVRTSMKLSLVNTDIGLNIDVGFWKTKHIWNVGQTFFAIHTVLSSLPV